MSHRKRHTAPIISSRWLVAQRACPGCPAASRPLTASCCVRMDRFQVPQVCNLPTCVLSPGPQSLAVRPLHFHC